MILPPSPLRIIAGEEDGVCIYNTNTIAKRQIHVGPRPPLSLARTYQPDYTVQQHSSMEDAIDLCSSSSSSSDDKDNNDERRRRRLSTPPKLSSTNNTTTTTMKASSSSSYSWIVPRKKAARKSVAVAKEDDEEESSSLSPEEEDGRRLWKQPQEEQSRKHNHTTTSSIQAPPMPVGRSSSSTTTASHKTKKRKISWIQQVAAPRIAIPHKNVATKRCGKEEDDDDNDDSAAPAPPPPPQRPKSTTTQWTEKDDDDSSSSSSSSSWNEEDNKNNKNKNNHDWHQKKPKSTTRTATLPPSRARMPGFSSSSDNDDNDNDKDTSWATDDYQETRTRKKKNPPRRRHSVAPKTSHHPPPPVTSTATNHHNHKSSFQKAAARFPTAFSSSSSQDDNDNNDDDDEEQQQRQETAAATGVAPSSRIIRSTQEPSSSTTVAGEAGKNNETTKTTMMIHLEDHCWVCHVPLRHPRHKALYHNDNTTTSSSSSSSTIIPGEPEVLWNSMHVHPYLQVPMCVVCVQQIPTTTTTTTTTDDDNNIMTEVCVGCGIHQDQVDVLYLCDNVNVNDNKNNDNTNHPCPFAHCQQCILQAHQLLPSTSPAATRLLEELQDSDKLWQCCHCAPPPPLAHLQDHLRHHILGAAKIKIPIPLLVGELQGLEAEKLRCEQVLEDPQQEEEDHVRQEIYQELLAALSHKEEEEDDLLDQVVEDEMLLWKESWQDHEARIADTICMLQDCLGEHGFQIHEYYRDQISISAAAAAATANTTTTTMDDSEPTWKQEADKVVDERIAQDRMACHNNSMALEWEPENYDDVEELASLSEDEGTTTTTTTTKRRPDAYPKDPTSWRISNPISRKALEEAWYHEERILTANAASATTKIRKISDQEDQESRRRAGASLHVSRDQETILFETQKRRETMTRQQQKPRQTEQAVRMRRRQHTSTTESTTTRRNNGGGTIRNPNNKTGSTITRMGTSNLQSHSKVDAIQTLSGATVAKKSSSATTPSRTTTTREQRTPSKFTIDDFIDTSNGNLPCGFDESPLIISADLTHEDDAVKITAPKPLADILKPHQKEAVKFIFRNAFPDLSHPSCLPGGCILAHNMGLGKSLSLIATVYSAMYHEMAVIPSTGRIKTILLLAPVNTITNWKNEWAQWTGRFQNCPNVYDISAQSGGAAPSNDQKTQILRYWYTKGGVLIMSSPSFVSLSKQQENANYLHNSDVVVLDEAHTMLKTNSSATFKALVKVTTDRRILLTGSPFQNSLNEYYRMVTYCRPGLFGTSERAFQAEYIVPIMNGTSSNASRQEKEEADRKLVEIRQTLDPYVHRRDATELLKDLPPLQQIILRVRPTKLQNKIYGAYKRQRDKHGKRDFFRQLHDMRPVNNHVACLLSQGGKVPGRKSKKIVAKNAASSNPSNVDSVVVKEETAQVSRVTLSSSSGKGSRDMVVIDLVDDEDEDCANGPEGDDEEDEEDYETEGGSAKWWQDVADEVGMDKFCCPTQSNKVVAFFHVLVEASRLNDKVLVFTQCLKTMEYLESVLKKPDWINLFPSLRDTVDNDSKFGSWKDGKDYLKMSGQDKGADRGDKIKSFNDDELGTMKLFLISSRAGGIGINLCSANRVVLFDSSFNPTIEDQAIYRCYRYGQDKSVFIYRLLTLGTMEEKIYGRAMNKMTLGNSLVDGKDLLRLFTAEEIADINASPISWAQCDDCDQWRAFPPEALSEKLPKQWYCRMMNQHDRRMEWNCNIQEKDQTWCDEYFRHPNEPPAEGAAPFTVTKVSSDNLSEEQEKKLIARDTILQSLLKVSVGHDEKKPPRRIISKYTFHDVLLDEARGDVDSTPNSQANSVISPATSTIVGGLPNDNSAIDKEIPAEETTDNVMAVGVLV